MGPHLFFQVMAFAFMASSCLGSPYRRTTFRKYMELKRSSAEVSHFSELKEAQHTTHSPLTAESLVTEGLNTSKQINEGAVLAKLEVSEGSPRKKHEVTESAVTTKTETTEGAVTTKTVTTEGAVTTKAETTEGAVTTKTETTEGAVTTKKETTEGAVTTKTETTEGAVTTKKETTEGAVTTKTETTDATKQIITGGAENAMTTQGVTEGAITNKEVTESIVTTRDDNASGEATASSGYRLGFGAGIYIPIPFDSSAGQDNDLKQGEEKKESHDSVVWGILPLIDDDGNKKSVFFINNYYDSKSQEFPDDGKTIEEKLLDFEQWRGNLTLKDKIGSGALAALVGGGG